MSSRNLRALIELGLPKTRSLALGLLIATLQGFSGVALLASSAWLISRASQQPNVVYISVAVVGVRAFAVGRSAFRYAERISLHDSAFRMLTDLRPRLFAKWIELAPAGVTNFDRGQAVQRMVADVDETQNLSLRVIAPIAQSVGVSIAASVFLALFAPASGLALLVAVTAALLIGLGLGSAVAGRADAAIVEAKAQLAESSLALIENADLLNAYGWANSHVLRLKQIDSSIRAKQRRSSFALGLVQSSFSLAGVLATCASAWFGALEVHEGRQPGVMLAVFALLPLAVFDVLAPSQSLAQAWNRYRTSAKRVLEFMGQAVPAEIPTGELVTTAGEDEASLEPIQFDSLELKAVSARYPNADREALAGLSFKLGRGERLFIRGESGSGKSTIANVLLRFLNASSGEYLLNGEPAANFPISRLRKTIGLIEQQPAVFLGTVRQNLLLANPIASDAELIRALERVALWQALEAREGLDTFVGEQGSLISGGEAARLAMARALLAEFQVLILDEPTANLDEATGRQTLVELLAVAGDQNLSVILISHDETLTELTASEVVVQKKRFA